MIMPISKRCNKALCCMSTLLISAPIAIAGSKRLVLFAGPHKAASGSVEAFFYEHASGGQGKTIAQGLEGWIWPTLPEDKGLWADEHPIEAHETFNALVTQADNATAQIILQKAIQDAWDQSEYGIIVGTPEFDRVANTPYTHRDGLKAMQGVIQQLRIGPEDVTVVLNYRTPRIDQWISMWKHAEEDDHYRKFLCKGNQNEQLELLDTAANPLKLAQVYREQSWNVTVIDMSGVDFMERDVAHVLACEVLDNTDCEDGFVVPIMQTYHKNYGGDKDLHSLDDNSKKNLEELFRMRDCFYMTELQEDNGVQVLYADSIWQGCRSEENEVHDMYERLVDPQLLLDAMRTQKKCAKNHVPMGDVIFGDYESMIVSTISDHGIEEEAIDETRTEERAAEEPLLASQSKKDSPILTGVFVILAFALGVYQLHLIQRRNGRFGDLREQEMEEISPNPSRLEEDENQEDPEGEFI